ncbi:MAG: helix-turn-helix transcriptional regulator [Clostridia bacterium]|nr:helix-turn-helix transcriptional regulator [Clostridia bacterium]
MDGNEIKNARLLSGYTQVEVSKATGIAQSTLSWIENNQGDANITQCIKLADFYNISLDELVGREYNKQTK